MILSTIDPIVLDNQPNFSGVGWLALIFFALVITGMILAINLGVRSEYVKNPRTRNKLRLTVAGLIVIAVGSFVGTVMSMMAFMDEDNAPTRQNQAELIVWANEQYGIDLTKQEARTLYYGEEILFTTPAKDRLQLQLQPVEGKDRTYLLYVVGAEAPYLGTE